MPDPQITAPPQSVSVTAPPQTPLATQSQAPPDQIPQQDAPTPPVPSAQQANVAHSAMVGHGFKALLSSMGGTTTQYQQTPEGPVPVQVKNSGGDFFRHILAGAILGGAAGAEHNDGSGAGYGGAARGAMAVHANDQQQQQLRQQEAQRQFQNKLTADKAQQEATGFDTEQQVRKAQIAQANAETLKTNVITQGMSYDQHEKVTDADKARIDTFNKAGVKPVFEDIPESQMSDIMRNRPGASTLDWRHTGVKTVLDANGNPTYEYTLSAYDPQQPLALSKGTIDQWDKDGLFKYHPEYKDMVKDGKTLTVGQFTALDRQAQDYYNQDLSKNKDSLTTQHIQAQIDEAHSAIKEHNTQTSLANLGIQEKQVALTEKKAADTAWAHLAAVGNDPDKLTDSHDKIALAKAAQPAMAETLQAIKDAQANPQDKDAQDSLPALWGRYTALTKLASLAAVSGSAAAPTSPPNFEKSAPPNGKGIPESRLDVDTVEKALAIAQSVPKEQALANLWSAPTLSSAEKKEVYEKLNNPAYQSVSQGAGKMGDDIMNAVTPSLGGKPVPPPSFPIPF